MPGILSIMKDIIVKLKKDPLAFIAMIFVMFIAFSFVGWAYEMLNDAIVRGGWHWRASLAGPWCPIYGIGGLLIVGLLGPLATKDVFKRIDLTKDSGFYPWLIRIVVLCVEIYLLVTAVELAGSYICEATMGYMPWDYSTSWGNFEGRIAPEFTIRFVIGGLVFLYAIAPLVRTWGKRSRTSLIAAAVILAVLFCTDNVLENAGVWSDVIPRETEVFVLPG